MSVILGIILLAIGLLVGFRLGVWLVTRGFRGLGKNLMPTIRIIDDGPGRCAIVMSVENEHRKVAEHIVAKMKAEKLIP